MSTILLNDTTMTDIADAIREKSGSTGQMLPSEMGGAIRGISAAEKRIIPTRLYADSSKVDVTGKGIVFLRDEQVSVTIDGASVRIPREEQGSYYRIVDTLPIRFNNSATIPADCAGIVGEETDVILTGNPVKRIYGSPNKSTPIVANGKGYAILSSEDYGQYARIGRVVLDGKTILNEWAGLYGSSIRLDFNQSISISYANTVNYQDEVSCAIYLFE